MVETALVWFRRDLRVHDNETLRRAVDEADRIVPLYCFDPRRFEGQSEFIDRRRVGPIRARFVLESVADLRDQIAELGGELLVHRGDPRAVVPEVAATFDTDVVHCQTLPAPEERETEGAIRESLESRGIEVVRHWTHTLHHVDDLPTPVCDVRDTFTPWKDEVESESVVREQIEAPERIETPAFEGTSLPTLPDLGFESGAGRVGDRATVDVAGGESAALDRLRTYVFERECLREYRDTRDGLLGMDFSSKLSPWLAQGCLSPRRVHETVRTYERERVSNDSTYWLLFELRWRDYFQFQLHKHGAAYFQAGGIQNRETAWQHDEDAFEQWAHGRTGFPFVDAAMRELAASGYQSNRARQNAASFLANTLGIDWRWGAALYEHHLVDYDVCSNWGNWAYIAGVGTDSRDRSFDVRWQAKNYDPDAEYVRHWLPELADLPPEYAQEPWRMDPDEQAGFGVELGVHYPHPMVDPDEHFDRPDY